MLAPDSIDPLLSALTIPSPPTPCSYRSAHPDVVILSNWPSSAQRTIHLLSYQSLFLCAVRGQQGRMTRVAEPTRRLRYQQHMQRRNLGDERAAVDSWYDRSRGFAQVSKGLLRLRKSSGFATEYMDRRGYGNTLYITCVRTRSKDRKRRLFGGVPWIRLKGSN